MTTDVIQKLTVLDNDELRTKDQWTGHVTRLKEIVRSPEFWNSADVQQHLDGLSLHLKEKLDEFINLQPPPGTPPVQVLQALEIHDMLEELYEIIDTHATAP